MPGIICSVNYLSKELEAFTSEYNLSDNFTEMLRYSYPADVCHKLLRDCRYLATHKPLEETVEDFLSEELQRRGYPTSRTVLRSGSILQWLLSTPMKSQFHILSDLSLGHIEMLIDEFYYDGKVNDSGYDRLRYENAYDAVAHEIYLTTRGSSVWSTTNKSMTSSDCTKTSYKQLRDSTPYSGAVHLFPRPRCPETGSGKGFDLRVTNHPYRWRKDFRGKYDETDHQRVLSSAALRLAETAKPSRQETLAGRVKSETPERTSNLPWWQLISRKK